MRIAITGASGPLGRALLPQLSSRDHETRIITRDPARASKLGMFPRVFPEAGDTTRSGTWQLTLGQVDAVVHLAAPPLLEGVARAHDVEGQRAVLAGRLKSLREVLRAIREASTPPKVLLLASSVTIYGARPDPVDERAPVGSGWLAETWSTIESEAASLRPRVRVVPLRLGQLLSAGAPLASVTDARALPPPSSTPFSFVHVADAANLVTRAIMNAMLDEPLNVVASPTTVAALYPALGLKPAPAPSGLGKLFKMGASSPPVKPEVVLSGQAARSPKARFLEFYPKHDTIEAAIKACRSG